MDNDDLLRIISDYNYNQERYNRNMAELINRLPNNNHNSGMFEFTFSPRDIASLISLFDISGSPIVDISGSTTVYNYIASDQLPLTCPITLETIVEGESVMKINRCGHIFKEAALRRWFDGHSQCPLCRSRLS
jgi:hypothetical protein